MMNYIFIKYIDFHGIEKQVIERNDNYYLVDSNYMNFEEISWRKDGSTAILIILDQDANEIIYVEQTCFKMLKEELMNIEDNQLNNARNLLKAIPD